MDSLQRCPIKRAMPMPMGARKVALCLTAASMMTLKTSIVVVNISIKTPLTMLVSPFSLTSTAMGPGNRADTTPAAAMAPIICAMKTTMQRMAGTARMSHSVKVT
jgi:hypothetical protein